MWHSVTWTPCFLWAYKRFLFVFNKFIFLPHSRSKRGLNFFWSQRKWSRISHKKPDFVPHHLTRWMWNVSLLKMKNGENNAVRVFCRSHWRWERAGLDLRQVHLRAERPWFTPRRGKCHLRLPDIIYVRESLSWCSVYTAEGHKHKRLQRGRRCSKFHCPFKRLIVFQNAINYMHTFTHFTRFLLWLSSNTLHIPLKFEHESHRRREKKKDLKWTTGFFFFFLFSI